MLIFQGETPWKRKIGDRDEHRVGSLIKVSCKLWCGVRWFHRPLVLAGCKLGVSWNLDVVMLLSSEGCNVSARWGLPLSPYHHVQYNSQKTFWAVSCQSVSAFSSSLPLLVVAMGCSSAMAGIWRLVQRDVGLKMERQEKGERARRER